jgi:hypothetical protein
MWLEYNLLQATIASPFNTSWLKVIICGQFGYTRTGSIRPNIFPVLASSSHNFAKALLLRDREMMPCFGAVLSL